MKNDSKYPVPSRPQHYPKAPRTQLLLSWDHFAVHRDRVQRELARLRNSGQQLGSKDVKSIMYVNVCVHVHFLVVHDGFNKL